MEYVFIVVGITASLLFYYYDKKAQKIISFQQMRIKELEEIVERNQLK
ncbi:hypothetical protein ACWE42_11890 [Sutcliffiella cohnii]|nr:hypothetical protein [Sutcliffiella sp. NC1]WBL16921.1 hypothetical protein O1A01_09930 [Sutcliffiella sp. NC1]